jgi:hypothetical protein
MTREKETTTSSRLSSPLHFEFAYDASVCVQNVDNKTLISDFRRLPRESLVKLAILIFSLSLSSFFDG